MNENASNVKNTVRGFIFFEKEAASLWKKTKRE